MYNNYNASVIFGSLARGGYAVKKRPGVRKNQDLFQAISLVFFLRFPLPFSTILPQFFHFGRASLLFGGCGCKEKGQSEWSIIGNVE